ncbi:MAG: hypothetical protein AB7D57_12775, partial [Desulfovibrionaceae bacterium]
GRDKYRLKKVAGRMERALSDINRAMRAVYADRRMTPGEKRERLDGIVQRRNELVQRAWERMRPAMRKE